SAARVGFFFQAEDGIRAFHVTGVQTCALPIYDHRRRPSDDRHPDPHPHHDARPGGHRKGSRSRELGTGHAGAGGRRAARRRRAAPPLRRPRRLGMAERCRQLAPGPPVQRRGRMHRLRLVPSEARARPARHPRPDPAVRRPRQLRREPERRHARCRPCGRRSGRCCAGAPGRGNTMTDPTPSVDEFLAAEKDDRNAWWRLGSGDHLNLFEEAIEQRDAARADRVCWRETHNQVAAERDALRGMVRRYHAGWYVVSASAPLRDVWCKDHYPDDGYVTEELTSAEADAFRRALDASPTEAPPTCDGIVPPTRHTAPRHWGRPTGPPGRHQYRPMDELDASPTEGNPE